MIGHRMANRPLPSPAELRQLLRYEPETGKLFWLAREINPNDRGPTIFNKRYAGKEAFTCRMGQKHLQGRVYNHGLLAHRVIWALIYGEWPHWQIDHINGNPTDNRLANLRDVRAVENQRNMKRPSNNTSGVSGVDWQEGRQRWRARIKVGGKNIHVGRFIEFGDAVRARQDALARHDFHPNHGRA